MCLRITLVYTHAESLPHFHSLTPIITRTLSLPTTLFHIHMLLLTHIQHTLSLILTTYSLSLTHTLSLILTTYSFSITRAITLSCLPHTLFNTLTFSLSHTHHVHFLLLRLSGADGADHRAGEQQQEAREPSAARTVSESLFSCM